MNSHQRRKSVREESRAVCTAFIEGRDCKRQRSWATSDGLWLHGHQIAQRIGDKYVVSLCGFPTQTTLDRLNTFTRLAFGVAVFGTHKGKVYFGDGYIREVDPDEKITLPKNWRPGDKPL